MTVSVCTGGAHAVDPSYLQLAVLFAVRLSCRISVRLRLVQLRLQHCKGQRSNPGEDAHAPRWCLWAENNWRKHSRFICVNEETPSQMQDCEGSLGDQEPKQPPLPALISPVYASPHPSRPTSIRDHQNGNPSRSNCTGHPVCTRLHVWVPQLREHRSWGSAPGLAAFPKQRHAQSASRLRPAPSCDDGGCWAAVCAGSCESRRHA